MSTELGMVLVGGGWVAVWLWAIFVGYERTPTRKDLWGPVFAFVVLKAGRPLPYCDAKHNGTIVQWHGDNYTCDATLGQWLKSGGGK